MKELTVEDYPFYKKKIPTSRESLIADNRKMALYWERLTTRNQDLSLERLKSESVAQLKGHYKWHISREAATIWLDWKNKTHLFKTGSSKKRLSKKSSSKKLSSKKRLSKKSSYKKRSFRKRLSRKSSYKKRSSKKRLSKKSSYKKRSSKKQSSKRLSSKRYVNNRHYKTSPSKERMRSERPSPSVGASSQKIGIVMKGNDGNMYKVVRTISGIRRWSKV